MEAQWPIYGHFLFLTQHYKTFGFRMTNFHFFNKKHINMDYELNIPVQIGSKGQKVKLSDFSTILEICQQGKQNSVCRSMQN